jgi:hypothetical protein
MRAVRRFVFVWLSVLVAGSGASMSAQRPSAMSPRQREAVRAAAAPYRGQVIELITSSEPSPAHRRFMQAFRSALEAAGLTVVARALPEGARGDCTNMPGLRVAYSAPLSGAANAIAEALVRSAAVPGSVAGCSIGGEATLRFILGATE